MDTESISADSIDSEILLNKLKAVEGARKIQKKLDEEKQHNTWKKFLDEKIISWFNDEKMTCQYCFSHSEPDSNYSLFLNYVKNYCENKSTKEIKMSISTHSSGRIVLELKSIS